MTPPWLLALALVIGLIVLVPARRLQLAGFSARTIGGYTLALWLFAMGIAIRPGATRVLIPFLLVAYIAPFVAAPDTVRRVLRRPVSVPPEQPPMKDVTPPGRPDVDEADRDPAGAEPHDRERP